MYFFPSERRRSLRREKRSRAGDHAGRGFEAKRSFPVRRKKRAAELARDIIYGKTVYAVNSEIGYFASSREKKAEQFAEAAELFYRDIFISLRSGRTSADKRRTKRYHTRMRQGLHSRTDDVGRVLCGDCAEDLSIT